jgi:hypothetical protein
MKNPIAEVPIKTLDQAKDFFRYMECSRFHMGREYPQRYDEYMQLDISTQTENEWRKESFYETYSTTRSTSDNSSLWRLHKRMYDLYAVMRSQEELIKLLEVSKYLLDKVPTDDKVIVAETINGRARREDREGLIYIAFDTGNIGAAKEFAELSLQFSSFDDTKKWKFWDKKNERNQRSTRLCKEIMNELGLQ